MLEELRSGGTNVEIAVRLGLSPETVKTHIASMLAKLGLDDRHTLASWRPDRERRRLPGLTALPPALASLGRPLLWAGVGAVGLAGAAAISIALVVVQENGEPVPVAVPTTAQSPRTTATPSPPPTPTPTTATPAPAATSTPSPLPTPTPIPTPAPGDPSTTTFRYDTYDTMGAVDTPGSYAFLSDPDDTSTAVTTYEGLRDGTTTALLIHTDADGVSRADVYDTVEEGDLFEWHQAGDCFVRYTVTEVKPDPAGTVPRKLLAVEWMTYAYSGCSGTISANANVGMTWSDLLDLGGVALASPVVHGRFHLVPENWEGTIEDATYHDPPDESPAFEERVATTLEAARALNLPYWREPTLPEGWTLSRAWEGGLDAPRYGFVAIYLTEPLEFPDGRMLRQTGLKVLGAFADTRRGTQQSSYADGRNVRETRVIAGLPAMILRSPPGPNYLWNADVHVRVYDPDNGSSYTFIISAPHRSDLAADGNAKLETAIAIVRTFFESPEEE